MKKKNLLIRRIVILSGLIITATVVILTITLALTMKPPEGNKTLNRSGSVSKEVTENIEDALPPQTPIKQIYTFLIVGMDKTSTSTDIIMLAKLDITNKKISILHIPRDTMLDTERKSKKINSSYSIGGIEQFEKDVSSITGFYVNRYVLFDIEGVEKIINAIGGVYFNIPQNMNYEDPTQDLYIHLKKGYQHLDGEDAVKLARFRSYPEGDITRISVQQDLLKALAEQALKAENILKIPELVTLISENVKSDIDLSEMLWLANEAKNIPFTSIDTDMVPGVADIVNGLSYWLPYKNELINLINLKFNPLDFPITEEDISIVSFEANEGR